MTIEKTISHVIESQFPAFYLEDGPDFIAFVKAYYEWLESDNNPLYQARRLLEYRDIDTTLDIFITQFKDKYLRNIDFDTATNKRLLVKNSLDIYRSKGSERSIDLLMQLVYGEEATVYYPGDDIFKLSAAEWVIPKYLEVTYSDTNVNYVGKQITGVVSGSSAFVEKYIKRNTKLGFVYIFYLSNIKGNFENNEALTYTGSNYLTSPTVIGSLNSLTILNGGDGFAIGDVVDIVSASGVEGKARVSGVGSSDGFVDFVFIDGGYGYTTSSNVIVSNTTLTISNVQSSNNLYFDTFELITQPLANVSYVNSTGNFVTNTAVFSVSGGSGNIVSVNQIGSNGNIVISVSSGSFASGNVFNSSNSVVATFSSYTDASVNGSITSSNITSITLNQAIDIQPLDVIYQTTGVTGTVVKVNGGSITLDPSGKFDSRFNITNQRTLAAANISSMKLDVGISSSTGTFISGALIVSPSASGQVSSVGAGSGASFNVAAIQASSLNYSNTVSNGWTFDSTGGDWSFDSSSSSFDILNGAVTVGYENIFINTDLLSSKNTANVALMSLPLNSTSYLFSKSSSANISSPMFSALTFTNMQIGAVSGISKVSPGTGYTINPDAIIYQQYVSGFHKHNQILYITGSSATFSPNETILQNIVSPVFAITVASATGFIVGEAVKQGSNTGSIASIANNVIQVRPITGVFNIGSALNSYTTTANSSITAVANSTITTVASGIVESANSSVIYVKRTSFNNKFGAGSIVGTESSSIATVTMTDLDLTSIPMGRNADVDAFVAHSNSSITSADVVDSGFGYLDTSRVVLLSDTSSGTAIVNTGPTATGSGYYRTSKGFLSDSSFIFDGEYYQEYSYEIISRIPFEKYSSMIKKVAHVAGAAMFGSVSISSFEDTSASYAISSVTQLVSDPPSGYAYVTTANGANFITTSAGANRVAVKIT